MKLNLEIFLIEEQKFYDIISDEALIILNFD